MKIGASPSAGGTPEGTAILSTGETGGTKFLREDGDGTSSWQPITGGGDALVANPLSQFAATTSLQFRGVISDETGSGSVVFADSPTLITPDLGTPSALVGTNITGTAAGLTAGTVTTNANLTGHITSVGNATVLGSFTVAQLSAALSDASISGDNTGDETTGSITALGALMDTELASEADVKALDQSVISGASPVFSTANMTDAANKRFMTDAQEAVLDAQSGTNSGDEPNASLVTPGIVELATVAETDTGTDDSRAVTPAGLAGSALATKVGTIETNADVTDTDNVRSSGALMDDELASIADVKALDQSVVSGASPAFSTANLTSSANKNLLTDAQVTNLGNQSGTNTGDETNASIQLLGALMDSELAGITHVKALNQSVVSGAAPNFDASNFTNIPAPEGTEILSTGETGGSKFLREDGDGTCSWQTIAGGGDALVANPLSQFAATTSAQLRGVISDESGTGALVFADSPTLITPALGTPSALVGTNITGTAAGLTAGNVTTNANLTGHITSVGNATTLGSFTVAQLSAALSDASISGNNTGDEPAASTTVAGVVELATTAEIDTGTDATRAMSPDAFQASNFALHEIGAVFDGDGEAIAVGSKVYVRVGFKCDIIGVTMLADVSGSAVVDVWVDSFANYPPTDADSITASAPPTISSDTDDEDTTLTGWTKGIDAGDVICFNVDSCSTITTLTVQLQVRKS